MEDYGAGSDLGFAGQLRQIPSFVQLDSGKHNVRSPTVRDDGLTPCSFSPSRFDSLFHFALFPCARHLDGIQLVSPCSSNSEEIGSNDFKSGFDSCLKTWDTRCRWRLTHQTYSVEIKTVGVDGGIDRPFSCTWTCIATESRSRGAQFHSEFQQA